MLVDFSQTDGRTLGTFWLPYTDEIRRAALGLQVPAHDELHRASMLANSLAQCFAEAVEKLLASTGHRPEQIAAIGCHGQTVRHQPGQGYSIQLNNPALLAELTRISVIADFPQPRPCGRGQGAPLVPAFHAATFAHPGEHRVVLNIGGIANLTDLNPGQAVRGFDCGPGNMLLDAWTEKQLGQRYDRDGKWAASGKPVRRLLESLLAEEYFAAPPPKSCGRDEFNLAWLEHRLGSGEDAKDVQATLLELSAVSIANAISRWCGTPRTLLACGGGVQLRTDGTPAPTDGLLSRRSHGFDGPACRLGRGSCLCLAGTANTAGLIGESPRRHGSTGNAHTGCDLPALKTKRRRKHPAPTVSRKPLRRRTRNRSRKYCSRWGS